ncbi:MAG: hypothetical protein JWN15_4183 [Firmicutes bacterium]|nr:hypothetical protein [Bacillota bacterium]
MAAVRRYSYVLVSLVLVGALVGYAIRAANATSGLLSLVVAAFLVIFWVVARRHLPMPANAEKRIRRARQSTRPVMVHFYSDYNLGCLLKRVLAAGAERGFRGRFDFIYIDMNHPEAAGVARSLQARLGDFVLFDATGREVAHSGLISGQSLERVLEQPAK